MIISFMARITDDELIINGASSRQSLKALQEIVLCKRSGSRWNRMRALPLPSSATQDLGSWNLVYLVTVSCEI